MFYHPTIVDGVQPGDALFPQETFGPADGSPTNPSSEGRLHDWARKQKLAMDF
jgi:hypothetical protein